MSVLRAEPPPAAGKVDVWLDRVQSLGGSELRDLYLTRRQQGVDKYGVPLQTFNGRDALVDLIQEIVDGIVYAHQVCLEEAERHQQLAAAQASVRELDTCCRRMRQASHARQVLESVLLGLLPESPNMDRVQIAKWGADGKAQD